jgi:hypothetical protein
MTGSVAEIDAMGVQPYSSAFSPSLTQPYGSRTRSAAARLTHVV